MLYESTARNFQTIVNKDEREILFEYSERGRLLSIVFIGIPVALTFSGISVILFIWYTNLILLSLALKNIKDIIRKTWNTQTTRQRSNAKIQYCFSLHEWGCIDVHDFTNGSYYSRYNSSNKWVSTPNFHLQRRLPGGQQWALREDLSIWRLVLLLVNFDTVLDRSNVRDYRRALLGIIRHSQVRFVKKVSNGWMHNSHINSMHFIFTKNRKKNDFTKQNFAESNWSW